jgi:hypothetical protein
VAFITRYAVRLNPVDRVAEWSVGSLPFGQSCKSAARRRYSRGLNESTLPKAHDRLTIQCEEERQ